MNTHELEVLVEAARAGSLSEAARRLGITPAVASKRLAALEAELRVRLMHRSTRRLSLTSEGEALLPHAVAVIESHDAARRSVAEGVGRAQGVLRVTAPVTFGARVLWPMLPEFLASNPDLELDLQMTDSIVDLRAESIDAALRIAPLADSTLVARRLCDNPLTLCAAPAYLKRHGCPKTVDDLSLHACFAVGGASHWAFGLGKQQRLVRVRGLLRSNSNEIIRSACLAGMGIALHSLWDVQPEIDAGHLVPIDVGIAPTMLAIWFVYPHRQHLPFRVKALYEHLVARVNGPSTASRREPLRRQPTGAASSKF